MADEDTQRYSCTYCGCDITLRLKCAVCADFDLCLECFASGAVAGDHRRDHAYQLIDEGSFPLLTHDWGAIEEVLLLETVEQDGFGNWEDIAAHVVTKTARESKDHYTETYINGPLGEGTIPSNYHITVLDGCGGDTQPPAQSSTAPVKLDQAELMELGYMPLRDDFEREYDNEAESLISGLGVNGDEEDELETALKLAQIEIYNRRVAEREVRKRTAKLHSLIGNRQRLDAHRKKYSKEERELRTSYKSLARLFEKDDYEQFIDSLKKEKLLRQKVKDLVRYRKNGITKLEECHEFDLMQGKTKKNTQGMKNSENMDENPITKAFVDGGGITSASPGLSLLSPAERKLCNVVSLKPQGYLNIKTEMLKSSALKRSGYSSKPKLPKHLDSEQKTRVNHFLSRAGWII